ncbi:MAG: elongation factor G [Bacteroidetes bacterium 4572_112]|nr:MAG: elongation factor G [Bacteroidetes bacterium 4572_112]
MKAYEAKDIRNIALVGHAGSGKTTFAETILYNRGVINRRGTVEENNTVSDAHELEHERGNSIFSSMASFETEGIKINLIDTPGYDDFIGEMIAPLRVCETALICINGHSPIEVGAENAIKYARMFKKSIAFVINKLDLENIDFEQVVEDIKVTFGSAATIFELPVNSGPGFDTVIDILTMKAYKYDDGKAEEVDIPADMLEKTQAMREELVESIAESDEELMAIYFEEGDLSEEQLNKGLKTAMTKGDIYPVLCSSAKKNIGTSRVVSFIKEVAPSPEEAPLMEEDPKVDANGKRAIFCFKMFSDAKLGATNYFKVKSGTIRASDDMINETNHNAERVGQVFTVCGKNRIELTDVKAGDLAATVKLKSTYINDTLHEKGFDVKVKLIAYPNYKMRTAVVPKTKGEEEKVGIALHALQAQDPTMVIEHSSELHQTILYAQGELHLAVAKWRLLNRYKVETDFAPAKVPYRETITSNVRSSYRHKKQSGGAGQFAEVHLMIDPYSEGMADPSDMQVRGRDLYDLPWGGKLCFLNCIVGGVIDTRFLPAILKGVMDKIENGPLTGCYARDIRVPIYNVSIKVPETYVGDIMSDLPTRRALILGIDAEGKSQKINTKMPLTELDKYATALRSMTQARASFDATFAEYQAVPMNIQQDLIKAYKAEQEEG